MAWYQKKPVRVEAVQLLWSTWTEMCRHAPVGKAGCRGVYVRPDGSWTDSFPGDPCKLGILIPTLEGDMLGIEGDWIIKGTEGEFYPCKPAAFAATFEPILPADLW